MELAPAGLQELPSPIEAYKKQEGRLAVVGQAAAPCIAAKESGWFRSRRRGGRAHCECSLSLTCKPTEYSPGGECLLEECAAIVFRNGAAFEGCVDGFSE